MECSEECLFVRIPNHKRCTLNFRNEQDGEQNIGLSDINRETDSTSGRRDSVGSFGSGGRRDSIGSTGTLGHRESIGGGGRQDSIGSRHDSLSGRQDSLHGRQHSLSGRQESISGGNINLDGRRESIGSLGSTPASFGSSNFGSVGDHASTCRARSRTCTDFNTCCNAACPNPIKVSCEPGQLYYAICRCPGDVTVDVDRLPTMPPRG